MKFAEPLWFILLLLIPLLHKLWSMRNQPPELKYSVKIPTGLVQRNPKKVLIFFRYAALVLLVVGLARPQWRYSQSERRIDGIDILLLLDVSASMEIIDLAETSRLSVAKETLERFVKGRSNDRIGFAIFSGEPLTLTPLTLDYGLVLKSIHSVELGVLRDGTAIGDGLAVAVSRLKDSTAKSKVVILTTDGDNNLGQIDPATAGDLAAGYGIRVYTIAIGKEGRVKVPIRRKGIAGSEIISYQYLDNSLNTELLELIAKNTKGRFYRVTDADTLEKVFDEINGLERTEIKTNEKVHYEEAFQCWLLYALVMLGFELLLSRFWWRLAL